MRLTIPIICLALTAAPATHAYASSEHPFDVRDLIAFDRLSDPQVSPDGRSVVFTISSLDLDANRRRTGI